MRGSRADTCGLASTDLAQPSVLRLKAKWGRSFQLQVAHPSWGCGLLGTIVKIDPPIAIGFQFHYKVIGHLTATLDYVLIVTASIVAGVGYHSVILQGDVPNLMPYVGAANIVAALFVLGATSRGRLQPECHCLGAPPSTIRHVVLVAGVSELGLVPLLGQVRSRFFTRNHHNFRLARIRVVARFHLWISATLKNALARGTIAGDRAITIGDRDAVMAFSQASILQKAGAREIRRYLLPPFNGSGYADGLRVIEEAIQFTRSNSVDCVLLALQWNDERRRNLICERLQILPIPVLLLPDQHVLSIFSRARTSPRIHGRASATALVSG